MSIPTRSNVPGGVKTVVPYVARGCSIKKLYPRVNTYAVINALEAVR